MVLTQTGTIYKNTDAVSKTNPAQTPQDLSCGDGDGDGARRTGDGKHGKGRGGPNSSKKETRMPAKKADIEVAYNSDNDSPSTYFRGTAFIWTGPVSISSRKYNLKYTTGYMDAVDWRVATEPDASSNDVPVQISAAQAAGKFLVNPYTYNLKVFKTRSDDRGHEREYEHDAPRHYERDYDHGYEGQHYGREPDRRN